MSDDFLNLEFKAEIRGELFDTDYTYCGACYKSTYIRDKYGVKCLVCMVDKKSKDVKDLCSMNINKEEKK